MVSPSISPWILAEVKSISSAEQNDIFMTKDMPETHSVGVYRARLAAASMQHRQAIVALPTAWGTSRRRSGFRGFINVPSDAQQHNVTISSFEFQGPFTVVHLPEGQCARLYGGKLLEWLDINLMAERTYLICRQKSKTSRNTRSSPGSVNMYVDGSFVATTSVPAVSPPRNVQLPTGVSRLHIHPHDTYYLTTIRSLDPSSA